MAFALSGELDFAGFCTILKGSVGKQCLVVEQKAPCQESLLTSDLGFIGGISEILVLGSRTCRDENTSAKNIQKLSKNKLHLRQDRDFLMQCLAHRKLLSHHLPHQ